MARKGLQKAAMLALHNQAGNREKDETGCVVCELWCMTCEERDRNRKEESEMDEEEKRMKLREVRLHKYVGETSRSMYECGLEHLRDLSELKPESHMLKHFM